METQINETSRSCDTEEGGYSYHEEVTKLEDLGRLLKNTQHRLNMASMRSHLLNVDVVTQFDPHRAETLRKTVQDCEECIRKIKEREIKNSELLHQQ